VKEFYSREDAEAALALSRRIQKILRGKDSGFVGAALADLVSLWIIAHHPDCREDVLQMWVKYMRKLMPMSEKQMFGDEGWHE